MNLHHQSVKTQSCLARDGHRTKNPEPNAIRYTRLKENKMARNQKSMEREKKILNIQAWKPLWRTIAVSWGHIEQNFKCYKIKSQVYSNRAICGDHMTETWSCYSFARVCKKGRFPDVVSLKSCSTTASVGTGGSAVWARVSSLIDRWLLPRAKDQTSTDQLLEYSRLHIYPTNQTLPFSMGYQSMD